MSSVSWLARSTSPCSASSARAALEDDDLRRWLGQRGRATVERLYSWDIVGQGMIGTYLSVANLGHRGFASSVATTGPGARCDHR